MATAFTHALIALAAGKSITTKPMPSRFWVAGVVCSIIPDADVLGFRFGIEYGDILGHRGLTHSLFFAAILAAVLGWTDFKQRPQRKDWPFITAYLFLCTTSHGLLDAMTDGGIGIAFFSPFDTTRYFLPWRPIIVSPIGATSFFSREGLSVITSEILWIWLPVLLLCGLILLIRKCVRPTLS